MSRPLRACGLGRWLAIAACAAVAACGGSGPAPVGPPAGLDVSAWVNASVGNIPVVILAPHGGDLSPSALPTRTCAGCVTVNDANTQALAQEIAAAFERRIAARPFVVINRLHRSKFDANRDLAEATGGHAPLVPMWNLWHASVDTAKAAATRLHPRALLIDLHGHSHAIARLELGYLLTSDQLRLSDAQLGPLLAGSSIRQLEVLRAGGDSGVAFLRGPRALGSRLSALGVPAVPSDATPAPQLGEAYFSGGFNTERHGSVLGGAVDAIQIECHFVGLRDTAENRRAFAESLVTALLAYLADYYDWTPAT